MLNVPRLISAPAVGPPLGEMGENEMSPLSSGCPLIDTVPFTAMRLDLPQPGRTTIVVNKLVAKARRSMGNQKSPIVSPLLGEPSACQVASATTFITNRPEPSANSTCTPPGCRLREETMFLRLLKAVCVAMHGARVTETHSTSRSQSGLLLLGVLFQWNRQYSGSVRLPRRSTFCPPAGAGTCRHSATSSVLLVPSVISAIRVRLLTMKMPG